MAEGGEYAKYTDERLERMQGHYGRLITHTESRLDSLVADVVAITAEIERRIKEEPQSPTGL